MAHTTKKTTQLEKKDRELAAAIARIYEITDGTCASALFLRLAVAQAKFDSREWDIDAVVKEANRLDQARIEASNAADVSRIREHAYAELLPEFKAEAKERQEEGGKRGAAERGKVAGRGRPKSDRPEGKNSLRPVPIEARARDAAASAVGVNPRYVDHAAAVKEADPALFEKVKTGEVTLPAAVREQGIDDFERRRPWSPQASVRGRKEA